MSNVDLLPGLPGSVDKKLGKDLLPGSVTFVTSLTMHAVFQIRYWVIFTNAWGSKFKTLRKDGILGIELENLEEPVEPLTAAIYFFGSRVHPFKHTLMFSKHPPMF